PGDAVWCLPDEFTDAQLALALETLWQDPVRRMALGQRAREVIGRYYAPAVCADRYAEAIETFWDQSKTGVPALIEALARKRLAPLETAEGLAIAQSMAHNHPEKRPARQLFLDVSGLVKEDSKTGVQRVTRSVLRELLHHPPAGHRVLPVYATPEIPGYCHARQFTLRFLDCPSDWVEDHPIEAQPGDLFLGLDLQHQVVIAQEDYLRHLYRIGIRVYFVVYDLLPVQMPHRFPPGTEPGHAAWLRTIAQFDGALAISRAVMDSLREWLAIHGPARHRPFRLGWFHQGSDIDHSAPTTGLPGDAAAVLSQWAGCPGFLMVGTLEPRKGHAQTLAAFESLWREGVQAHLVIVGRAGWMEALVESIRSHPERNRRLFWLEDTSDEYLEKIYAASTCLIAASEGEGFGLPLIEAARHKIPLIVRDIPVFREVAGEHAFYFRGMAPEDLARAVKDWLEQYATGRHPSSEGLACLTWKDSVEQLKRTLHSFYSP
ncbi:MAG: glycosyltransferase, partial [Pseudomonadota bacterium]